MGDTPRDVLIDTLIIFTGKNDITPLNQKSVYRIYAMSEQPISNAAAIRRASPVSTLWVRQAAGEVPCRTDRDAKACISDDNVLLLANGHQRGKLLDELPVYLECSQMFARMHFFKQRDAATSTAATAYHP